MKIDIPRAIRSGSFVLASLFLASAPVATAAVVYSASGGTAYQAPALTGFATSGDMMDGMFVRVKYADGSVAADAWGSTGVGAGAASAAGMFLLSESGDTFGGVWSLTNHYASAITHFSLFGAPGNTVFDRTTPSFGTDGSFAGMDFVFVGASAGRSASVEYTDIFNLTGFPAVSDVYVTLNVDISMDSLLTGHTLTFNQDTDNADAARGGISQVPDSGMTSLLIGLGLAGLVALRRRLA
jgi:hypothetical protein